MGKNPGIVTGEEGAIITQVCILYGRYGVYGMYGMYSMNEPSRRVELMPLSCGCQCLTGTMPCRETARCPNDELPVCR